MPDLAAPVPPDPAHARPRDQCPPDLDLSRTSLGIELGSTRIKAVLSGPDGTVLARGAHEWVSTLVDGVWTYDLDQVMDGLRLAYGDLARDLRTRHGIELTTTGALGVSGMMHGYLPLDADGGLLTAFRTWRNTMTARSSAVLSRLFGVNIPQRWSIAHLHHAIAGGEEHVERIARLTTLAGYVHWLLTGRHILGVGEASGMFPIDASGRYFDSGMLAAFDREVLARRALPWRLSDILPQVALAGQDAGELTAEGARLLDPTGALGAGVPLCPPEGDAGTGMVATNAVRPRTGNVSAGTSAFAMIVLDHPLRTVVEQIDLVATPSGAPVAMAHANNCSSDLNAWVEVFSQFADIIGRPLPRDELFSLLLEQAATGSMDEAGVLSYNFLAGDALLALPEGRPLTMRRPDAVLSLAGLMRSHLFALFAAMAHGLRVLRETTDVPIESMHAHGGIFKTPHIPQRILSAAFDTPVSVSATAGEGGAWGMSLLAGYRLWGQGRPLEDYLDERIFSGRQVSTLQASAQEVDEYNRYLERFVACLPVQLTAVEVL